MSSQSKEDKERARQQAKEQEAAAQGRGQGQGGGAEGTHGGDVREVAKQNKGMNKRQREAGADRLPGESDQDREQRRATQTDQPIQAQSSSTITTGAQEAAARQAALADQNRGKPAAGDQKNQNSETQ